MVPYAVGGERLQLIVHDQPAVMQQPADQCRLAVVDRPAGDQTKQVLRLASARTAPASGLHQK
jgi:hypothetical protein